MLCIAGCTKAHTPMHESACTNAQMCMTECTEVCFSKFPYGKKKIRMSSAEDLNLSGLTSVSSKFKTFNFGLFPLTMEVQR